MQREYTPAHSVSVQSSYYPIHNPKKFWYWINSMKSFKPPIPSLLSCKAEKGWLEFLISIYFCSMSADENCNNWNCVNVIVTFICWSIAFWCMSYEGIGCFLGLWAWWHYSMIIYNYFIAEFVATTLSMVSWWVLLLTWHSTICWLLLISFLPISKNGNHLPENYRLASVVIHKSYGTFGTYEPLYSTRA